MRVAMLLTTERVALRELAQGDLDFLAEMLSDPEVMRHYPKCLTRPEAEAWIEQQQERYRRDRHGLWLASLHRTGAPIGQVGLLRQVLPDGAEWEIGYLLHKRFWHQGYATEAAIAVREYAFRVLMPPKVISLIRPANTPSQRVARRLGMNPVARVQFSGLDHDVFAVMREQGEA